MPRTFKVFHRVILLAWAAPEGGAVARGATTAEKLRGSRFGSQHRGACTPRPVKGRPGCLVREGVAPSRCEGPGMSPRKIFENSDVKSCILVTLAVKYLAFWKLRPRSWGDQYIVGPPTVGRPVSCGPYGCCAYSRGSCPLCPSRCPHLPLYHIWKLWRVPHAKAARTSDKIV